MKLLMKYAKLFQSFLFLDSRNGMSVGDDKGAVSNSETGAMIPEFGSIFEVVCADSDDAGSYPSNLGHQFGFRMKRARPSRYSCHAEANQDYLKKCAEAY
jgi:hypothetical protein